MSENKLILVHVFDKVKYYELSETRNHVFAKDCYRELLIDPTLIIKVEEFQGNPFANSKPSVYIDETAEGMPTTVMETSNSGKYFVKESVSYFKKLFLKNVEG